MNPASPAEEMAAIGSITDTLTILGKKLTMHTLDSDDEAVASSACAPFDKETRERIMKIEKLARAITQIDGAPFSLTEEDKLQKLNEVGKARKLIFRWHQAVVDKVYAGLLTLEARREQAVEALEKNAPTPTKPSGSGK